MRALIIVLALFLMGVSSAAAYTGKGVTIVVNDSGSLYEKHSDVITPIQPFLPGDHAAKVVETIRQIAPDAEIHYVEKSRYFRTTALNYANEVGAQLFNYSQSPPLTARPGDPLVIAAAGNTGSEVDYFVDNDTVVAVGAAAQPYSSYGEGIDVWAPAGFRICPYVKCPQGIGTYFHGTSASAPYVTGHLALFYEEFKATHGRFPTHEEARASIYERHPSNEHAVLAESPEGKTVYVHEDFIGQYDYIPIWRCYCE